MATKSLPLIGSKFTGANSFRDTQHGVFWEVFPQYSDTELKLQQGLIFQGAVLLKVWARVRNLGRVLT